MIRLLPAVMWVLGMYVATALTAGVDAAPAGGAARVLFEARHIVIHALGFAVLGMLIAWPLRVSARPDRSWMTLFGAALGVGIGQEALQAVLRERVYLGNSLLDAATDVMGAVLGLWIVLRWRALRRPHPQLTR